jgi:hypothetical protein
VAAAGEVVRVFAGSAPASGARQEKNRPVGNGLDQFKERAGREKERNESPSPFCSSVRRAGAAAGPQDENARVVSAKCMSIHFAGDRSAETRGLQQSLRRLSRRGVPSGRRRVASIVGI